MTEGCRRCADADAENRLTHDEGIEWIVQRTFASDQTEERVWRVRRFFLGERLFPILHH